MEAIIRPLAAKLTRIGVTANQVTLASLAGSIAVGAVPCINLGNSMLFTAGSV